MLFLHMQNGFIPKVSTFDKLDKPALWFIYRDNGLLLKSTTDADTIPVNITTDPPLDIQRAIIVGSLNGQICVGAVVDKAAPAPQQHVFVTLRQSFQRLGEPLFAIAGRARQILYWDQTHRYCGCCGQALAMKLTDVVKTCAACGHPHFPRVSPAIIVAVTRGKSILLARSSRFSNSAMFSVLAGFVEAGETLETCVAREIFEEVGIRVKDIRYFGSQPWPFPNSLMVGFTAVHDSGEIRVDTDEIVEARWFRPEKMPMISSPPSIARQLIDDFLNSHHP